MKNTLLSIALFVLGGLVGSIGLYLNMSDSLSRQARAFTQDIEYLYKAIGKAEEGIFAAVQTGNADLRLQAYDKAYSEFGIAENAYGDFGKRTSPLTDAVGKWSFITKRSPLTDAIIVDAVLESDSKTPDPNGYPAPPYLGVEHSGTISLKKNGDYITIKIISIILERECRYVNRAVRDHDNLFGLSSQDDYKSRRPLDVILRLDAKPPVNLTLSGNYADFVFSDTDQEWLLKELRSAKSLLLYYKKKFPYSKNEADSIQILFSPSGIETMIDRY